MIVKMKKVFLVTLDSVREEALEKLRQLGVVHIEKENKTNETINSLIEKRTLFEKSINSLPKQKKDKQKSVPLKQDFAEAEKISIEVNKILEKIHTLEDEKERSK
jgi:V/A-type H+-transporting ATPase subunit I